MTALIDADAVLALGPAAAAAALRDALAAGLDPDRTVPRTVLDLAHGQGLLMPAEAAGWFGVKVATIAPGNPARGLDRINATYLLHDSQTLQVQAILDGVALTTLRTPAVSVAAGLSRIRALAERSPQGLTIVVFGSGPQAEGHVLALRAQAPLQTVSVVTRQARPVPDWADEHIVAGTDLVRARVAEADVVVTATSARSPVFDGAAVRKDALVVAVGSHEPTVRELDGALLGRSSVVVESREVANRESGDVILAIAEGHLRPDALVTMADLLSGPTPREPQLSADRPLVVKTSGMGWQDLIVAIAVHQQGGHR